MRSARPSGVPTPCLVDCGNVHQQAKFSVCRVRTNPDGYPRWDSRLVGVNITTCWFDLGQREREGVRKTAASGSQGSLLFSLGGLRRAGRSGFSAAKNNFVGDHKHASGDNAPSSSQAGSVQLRGNMLVVRNMRGILRPMEQRAEAQLDMYTRSSTTIMICNVCTESWHANITVRQYHLVAQPSEA